MMINHLMIIIMMIWWWWWYMIWWWRHEGSKLIGLDTSFMVSYKNFLDRFACINKFSSLDTGNCNGKFYIHLCVTKATCLQNRILKHLLQNYTDDIHVIKSCLITHWCVTRRERDSKKLDDRCLKEILKTCFIGCSACIVEDACCMLWCVDTYNFQNNIFSRINISDILCFHPLSPSFTLSHPLSPSLTFSFSWSSFFRASLC